MTVACFNVSVGIAIVLSLFEGSAGITSLCPDFPVRRNAKNHENYGFSKPSVRGLRTGKSEWKVRGPQVRRLVGSQCCSVIPEGWLRIAHRFNGGIPVDAGFRVQEGRQK